MHPILLHTRWFTIHTYGLTAALGFAAGFLYSAWEAKRQGRDPQLFVDLTFFMIVCGVLGARILYVIINWREEFSAHPLDAFAIWKGGLVFYGGLIFATVVGVSYMYVKKIPVWLGTDVLYPATILGLGIGRIGCLMAGCCYGKVCTLPWAIEYPPGHPTYPHLVHPAPIYAFLSCIAMWLISVGVNRRKTFHGETSGVLLIMYAVYRYLIEFIRGDFERGWLIEGIMSTSQFISIPIIAFGVFLLLYLRKNKIPEDQRVPAIAARLAEELRREEEKQRRRGAKRKRR